MNRGRMLFHRDFHGPTGGHGKVRDYFGHALALGWDARVYLTPGSLRDASNPWMDVPERIEPQWRPDTADMLFLAGMDWAALPNQGDGGPPILNLVQGVRHADPALPLHGWLDRPAWRICVSHPVAVAIAGTGRVNGQVRVIPAAIDLVALQSAAGARAGGTVFIGAAKDPALGIALAARLRDAGLRVDLATRWMTRPDYLVALASAEIAIPLPLPQEGFFLPGLEAMALGCLTVMPHCIGSHEYARDGKNCVLAARDPEALAAAVLRLGDREARGSLLRNARETAARHDLPAEQAAFGAVLEEATA